MRRRGTSPRPRTRTSSNSHFGANLCAAGLCALSWARNSAGATPRQTGAWLAAGAAGRRQSSPRPPSGSPCIPFGRPSTSRQPPLFRVPRPQPPSSGNPVRRRVRLGSSAVSGARARRGDASGGAQPRVLRPRIRASTRTPFGLAPPTEPFPSATSSIAALASSRAPRTASRRVGKCDELTFLPYSYALYNVQRLRCGMGAVANAVDWKTEDSPHALGRSAVRSLRPLRPRRPTWGEEVSLRHPLPERHAAPHADGRIVTLSPKSMQVNNSIQYIQIHLNSTLNFVQRLRLRPP